MFRKFLKDDRGEVDGFLAGCLVALVVVAIIGCAIVTPIFHLFGYGIDTVKKTADGVVQTTMDPANVLQKYHSFHDKYNDYLAAKQNFEGTKLVYIGKLKKLPADQTKWSFEMNDQMSKLQTTALGQYQYVNQLAAEYNSDSEKADFNLFKDLPEWARKFTTDAGPLPKTLDQLPQSELEGVN